MKNQNNSKQQDWSGVSKANFRTLITFKSQFCINIYIMNFRKQFNFSNKEVDALIEHEEQFSWLSSKQK